MARLLCTSLVLAFCVLAVMARSQDHVLRFMSHDQVAQKAKEQKSDIILSGSEEGSQASKKFGARNTMCPNGVMQCSASTTCCPLQNGQYGCCDGVNAVCCNDGVHCCPTGYTCDEEHGQCVSVTLGLSFRWPDRKMVQAEPLVSLTANKVCNDSKTICEGNDTCCNATHGYGCCPILHAVCCMDKIHCCPPHTRCDMAHRRCFSTEGDWEQPWVEKRGVEPEPDTEVADSQVTGVSRSSGVMCPDGRMCADGQTCCQMADGGYGCCGFADAVCCSDHEHCCPHDYQCDYTKQGCVGGWVVHRWSQITRPANYVAQFGARNTVCPNGVTQCSATTTCCPLQNGQYGCCDGVNAVCCNDGVHCCPTGYTCDEEHGQCVSVALGLSFRWPDKKMVQAEPLVSLTANKVCNDSKTICEGNDTCCNATHGYGCCPILHAVCCMDKIHCCPPHTRCDMAHRRCFSTEGDWEQSWVEKRGVDPEPDTEVTDGKIANVTKSGGVMCPDGRMCADGQTCCPMSDGGYGCCSCADDNPVVPFLKMVTSVVCPDKSECPSGSTCCKLSSGDYGCCPQPNAVCCNDGIHCCPHGTTCDVAQGTCTSGSVSQPMKVKTPALSRIVTSVVCPDQSECPNGNTCCKLSSGDYGCCPEPDAVCCSDGVHCCPHGYTCDVAQGTCTSGSVSQPMKVKTPALSRIVTSVVCPDQSECPSGSTCCMLSSGDYGCCPEPNAVCCSDGVHCCPHGTTCDVAQGTCTSGSVSQPMKVKTPALSRMITSVVCPDQSECPNGNTCCKLSSGDYGCCPEPNAVCCSDGVHCCPHGYTCDVAQGTCTSGSVSQPMKVKTPALSRIVTSVVCPDQSECPNGNTCCKLSSGDYGCCPEPNAVCCSDGVHCCPHGTTCDVAQGTCTSGSVSQPMKVKTPALSRVTAATVQCPDGSSCPDGNTCCAMGGGQYGCCPHPQATCCNDGVHCCPNGYKCDVAAGTCNKGLDFVSMMVKTQSTPSESSNVICPDGQSECLAGQTCCQTQSGQYACCPEPNATCCSDGVHCCPSGYKCDVAAGTCTQGLDFVPMMVKAQSIPSESSNVICPDGESECLAGQTCCQTQSGQYACCPEPNATCCSDGVHCCPNGYKCDVAAGTCTKRLDFVPMMVKAQSTPRTESVVCPDKQSQCPDGQTCCKLSSGQYGCCPYPDAKCCSDGLHCCPNGYKCDVAAGTCTQGLDFVPMMVKAQSIPRVDKIICPGGGWQCPNNQTCCLMVNNEYGCCPYPEAVCCADRMQCCPSGYECDVSAGFCTDGVHSFPWGKKQPATRG